MLGSWGRRRCSVLTRAHRVFDVERGRGGGCWMAGGGWIERGEGELVPFGVHRVLCVCVRGGNRFHGAIQRKNLGNLNCVLGVRVW